MHNNINVFIQARMSSKRFPGKVLAPILGKPLIKNIIDSVKKIKCIKNVVVITSYLESDDPLVAYLESIGCLYFRGDLDNVFKRFQDATKIYPSDYVMRLCADSPFLNLQLMNFMVNQALSGTYSLISNVFIRTFPKGQSVEILKSILILKTDFSVMSYAEQEHVTTYFYRHIERKKCLFFQLSKDLSTINHCIDRVEDIESIHNACRYTFDLKEIRNSDPNGSFKFAS